MAFKDYTGLIGEGLSGGLKFFGSQEERKAAEAQADSLRAKGLNDIEVAKIMLEGKKYDLEIAKSGAGKTTQAGSKTLYIALGIGGVVILGVVIFAVTRKRA